LKTITQQFTITMKNTRSSYTVLAGSTSAETTTRQSTITKTATIT
jgi:hypothetical protein